MLKKIFTNSLVIILGFVILGIFLFALGRAASIGVATLTGILFLIVGLLFGLSSLFIWNLLSIDDKIDLAFEAWEKSKPSLESKYELLPNEKILIQATPSYVELPGYDGPRGNVHFVLVTNKRIIVGRYFHALAVLSDKLGVRNFWKPSEDIKENDIPAMETGEMRINLKIRKIELANNAGRRYIKIGGFCSIYHPDSKQIVEAFS